MRSSSRPCQQHARAAEYGTGVRLESYRRAGNVRPRRTPGAGLGSCSAQCARGPRCGPPSLPSSSFLLFFFSWGRRSIAPACGQSPHMRAYAGAAYAGRGHWALPRAVRARGARCGPEEMRRRSRPCQLCTGQQSMVQSTLQSGPTSTYNGYKVSHSMDHVGLEALVPGVRWSRCSNSSGTLSSAIQLCRTTIMLCGEAEVWAGGHRWPKPS